MEIKNMEANNGLFISVTIYLPKSYFIRCGNFQQYGYIRHI